MSIWLYLALTALSAAGYHFIGRFARAVYERTRQRGQQWP